MIKPTLPGLVAALLLSTPLAHALDLTALPGLTVTSSYDYPFAGAANGPKGNAVDHLMSTSWNGGGYSGWLQLDFGQAYLLDAVDVYGIYSQGAWRTNQYTLSVSDDGVQWVAVANGAYQFETALGGAWGGHHAFAAGSEPSGRYLRYTRTGGGDWAYLTEIEVRGHLASPAASPVPSPGCRR